MICLVRYSSEYFKNDYCEFASQRFDIVSKVIVFQLVFRLTYLNSSSYSISTMKEALLGSTKIYFKSVNKFNSKCHLFAPSVIVSTSGRGFPEVRSCPDLRLMLVSASSLCSHCNLCAFEVLMELMDGILSNR